MCLSGRHHPRGTFLRFHVRHKFHTNPMFETIGDFSASCSSSFSRKSQQSIYHYPRSTLRQILEGVLVCTSAQSDRRNNFLHGVSTRMRIIENACTVSRKTCTWTLNSHPSCSKDHCKCSHPGSVQSKIWAPNSTHSSITDSTRWNGYLLKKIIALHY